MTTHKYPGLTAILPLFLVVFIDAMGMAVIFPILTPVYMDPNGILPMASSLHLRNLLYGFTMCVFPLAMFFGTPILGDLSDLVGRKKILIICLCGVGISYILSGVAIIYASVTLLILSRAIAGLFAGSMATAQAAVIDVSPPEKKASNISLLLFPAAMGFVVGPLIGGFLSDKHLVSWFGLETPMFLAGILALLNAVLLWYGFHETHKEKAVFKFKIHRGVEIFAEAFANKNIRSISIIYLCLQLGWSLYFQFISLFLLIRYHYTSNHIGAFMAILGVGFALAMLYLVRFFTQYFSNMKIIICALLLSSVCLFSTLIPNLISLVWILGFLLALSMAISYPLLITLYSNLVGEDKQGWIMGVGNAVMGVAWALTGACGGLLQGISNSLGLAVAGIFMSVATVLMYLYSKKQHRKMA